MWTQHELTEATKGRGFYVQTPRVARLVSSSSIRTGLCHLFLQHTSASLCITENADPDVHADLEKTAQRLAPNGAPFYAHDAEGPDDMSAHVRTLLNGYELTIPIRDGRLALGTWQGIYLWEHRTGPQRRTIVVTLNGGA